MRILFFVHRFGRDVVGGPEQHLWNLAEQMARMGCRVEVATTCPAELSAWHRFGERWHPQSRKPTTETIEVKGATYPIEIIRFPVRNLPRPVGLFYGKLLQRRWEREEQAMQPAETFSLPYRPNGPLLLTGWHLPDLTEEGKMARWTMRHAALQLPPTHQAALHLQGWAPRQVTIQFEHRGQTRTVFQGKNSFQVNIPLDDCSDPSVGVLTVDKLWRPWFDTRSLGVQLTHISLSTPGSIHLAPFHVDHRLLRAYDKNAFINAYIERAHRRPHFYGRMFDQLRGPLCPGMTRFLKTNANRYDWVLTGTLPFSTVSTAAAIHRKTPFRLAVLPLFHVDDDFYYWRHYAHALRKADLCLANSWFSNETFFPAVATKSYLAGAGVNDALFRRSSISGARFRKRHGFAPDEKIVLCVGRKSGAKLYRTVAKAVDNIQDRVRCRFVLVGQDEDRMAISFPTTTYLGVLPQDELLDAYDACDVFCLMSESESFGLPFVEAWMREKPVIGNANCAPVAHLIQHGVTGLLASHREQLEQFLVELLNDPERCRAYGKAGLEQSLRSCTWQVITRNLLDRLDAAGKE